ncbi:MAG: murein biosynthesis integral membrane protein MurJ [Rhizobiales bacterium]|nr:murein biosynthesis integral membrane protein MurJ [Hyphomicrobiales bacterium]
MIKSIFSVSALTLISRIIGFVRDVMLASVLGAGALSDAFNVAFRIPNHFRTIFAEGAFNAAFVPAFAKVAAKRGHDAALVFADRIFAYLMIVQMLLLGGALIFMPAVVSLLAPGFVGDDARYGLAVELTRITFPYLAFISLVVLVGGVLNSVGRFAAPAATAILLNLAMIVALLLSGYFPTAGHAVAWGVLVSGVLQFVLVAADALRANVMLEFRLPRVTPEVKQFWSTFLPAAAGSAGSQIAVFADTIIASFLVDGAITWLYFADRMNQLPVGVIAVAVGTVLLSEMSRRIAAGDEAGARHAQMRAIELTLVFTLPAVAAFMILPDTLMGALFVHGKFTAADALQSARALSAYAFGLAAFVLIRTFTVTFHSRGDTRTPVIAMVIAVLLNIGLKLVLMRPLGHVGLALATGAGAWMNLMLLGWFARRQGLMALDARAKRVLPRLLLAFVVLCATLVLGRFGLKALVGTGVSADRIALIVLMALGAVAYGGALIALFGREFIPELKRLRRGVGTQG